MVTIYHPWGRDCEGGTLQAVNFTTHDACMELCTSLPRCSGFTTGCDRDRRCMLKSRGCSEAPLEADLCHNFHQKKVCDESKSNSDREATYRGCQSKTASGRSCQRWDAQQPHAHLKNFSYYPAAGLERNFCRNPDNQLRVWCYTMDPGKRREYCIGQATPEEPFFLPPSVVYIIAGIAAFLLLVAISCAIYCRRRLTKAEAIQKHRLLDARGSHCEWETDADLPLAVHATPFAGHVFGVGSTIIGNNVPIASVNQPRPASSSPSMATDELPTTDIKDLPFSDNGAMCGDTTPSTSAGTSTAFDNGGVSVLIGESVTLTADIVFLRRECSKSQVEALADLLGVTGIVEEIDRTDNTVRVFGTWMPMKALVMHGSSDANSNSLGSGVEQALISRECSRQSVDITTIGVRFDDLDLESDAPPTLMLNSSKTTFHKL